MNQMQAILEHLQSGKGITSLEAINKYGCTRLSDKIFRLRRKGYDIRSIRCEGVDRFGNATHYVNYVLYENEED